MTKTDAFGLSFLDFSKKLLESLDIDPLYVALHGAQMPREKLCRWLVAYWSFYHAGLCCWIVDHRAPFWIAMMEVAQGGTAFPRGTERRHFRGDLAITSVTKMRAKFPTAESLVNWLIKAGPRASGVISQVKTLHGFGEWISWKVPDMIERLGLAPLRFEEEDLKLMFPPVQRGAQEVFNRYCEGIEPDQYQQMRWAHQYALSNLSWHLAPPLLDRPLNVQETETLFCKWKAHLNGHYEPGKDTHEIREGLLCYARCRTAQSLLRSLPRES